MKFFEVKLPSNHKFGFLMTIIFLLTSSYAYYIKYQIMFYILGAMCIIFLITTIINADALLPLNKLWMKFGILIGTIINPILMGIIFFGIFTPISVLMRISGRDELRLCFKKRKTYWINRETTKFFDSFKKQF